MFLLELCYCVVTLFGFGCFAHLYGGYYLVKHLYSFVCCVCALLCSGGDVVDKYLVVLPHHLLVVLRMLRGRWPRVFLVTMKVVASVWRVVEKSSYTIMLTGKALSNHFYTFTWMTCHLGTPYMASLCSGHVTGKITGRTTLPS